MVALVHDPMDEQSRDFFTKSLHLSASLVPNSAQFHVQTFLPLVGCDPLCGIRTVTAKGLAALALRFKPSLDNVTEIAKFSNQCLSLTTQTGMFYLHAKSSGFDEYPSFKLQMDNGKYHFSLQTVCADPRYLHSFTFGVCTQIAKHVFAISQLTDRILSIGLKFQPCSHMHAGIGWSTDKIMQGSLLLGDAQNNTFALYGTTKKVAQVHAQMSNGAALFYSYFDDRIAAHLTIKLAAERIRLNIRCGIEILRKDFHQPMFTLHFNARENEP